jgi:AcrR family transcriptional regulator
MNIPNARERILKSAVKIFAEKSFEGSRIDEIAKEANVPKSLIYYHFKSKDEILEVLTQNFINEYINIIEGNANESNKEKAERLPNRMKNVYYDFGQKNSDLLRLIFIDSLKKTKKEPIIFKVIETMIAKEHETNTDAGYDVQERRIAEFFTSFIPNYAYICFADSWTKYFNIERTEFDKLYLDIYDKTHGEYHRNHK